MIRTTVLALSMALVAAGSWAQPAPAPQIALPNGTVGASAVTLCWGGAALVVCPIAGVAQPTAQDLDIATVSVASTAVNALSAGDAAKGAWIGNPNASATICVRETGVAGTVSGASGTWCIPAGATYAVAPTASAVSVNSATAGALIAGKGYK